MLLFGLSLKSETQVAPWSLAVPAVALLVGGLLLILGGALQRRRRQAWLPAVLIGLLGLAAVPIGTMLFGFALYLLWRERASFFPFDRKGIVVS